MALPNWSTEPEATVTEEMLRRRAEHNDGMLTGLREISLHQQHIERITLLNQLCRHLRVLHLQNNLISKIENLNRLKASYAGLAPLWTAAAARAPPAQPVDVECLLLAELAGAGEPEPGSEQPDARGEPAGL